MNGIVSSAGDRPQISGSKKVNKNPRAFDWMPGQGPEKAREHEVSASFEEGSMEEAFLKGLADGVVKLAKAEDAAPVVEPVAAPPAAAPEPKKDTATDPFAALKNKLGMGKKAEAEVPAAPAAPAAAPATGLNTIFEKVGKFVKSKGKKKDEKEEKKGMPTGGLSTILQKFKK